MKPATPEELTRRIAELEAANAKLNDQLTALAARVAALEAAS